MHPAVRSVQSHAYNVDRSYPVTAGYLRLFFFAEPSVRCHDFLIAVLRDGHRQLRFLGRYHRHSSDDLLRDALDAKWRAGRTETLPGMEIAADADIRATAAPLYACGWAVPAHADLDQRRSCHPALRTRVRGFHAAHVHSAAYYPDDVPC